MSGVSLDQQVKVQVVEVVEPVVVASEEAKASADKDLATATATEDPKVEELVNGKNE